jgi:2',3'-cyclic-nucleotide 2'-phosphodiesterase (5'-nucleotidase family)
MKNLLIILLFGAGLSACSFSVYKKVHSKQIPVLSTNTNQNTIDSLILPYKEGLDTEMNQIIGKAYVDFTKNRPNGNLNNLIADILLSTKKELGILNEQVICLQNFGGLRSTINKGNVSLGDIYKVLPFDNYIVGVKLPSNSIPKFISWMKSSNGHPIAGCKLVKDQLIMNNQKIVEGDFWIITSDYLVNGGDNAVFLSEHLEKKESTLLLRDVVINYIKANPNLLDDNKERIKFE